MTTQPGPLPGMRAEAATEAALARVASGFAAAIALLLVLMVPAIYGWAQWRDARAGIRAEARLMAQEVSRIASLSPDLWMYQDERLRARLGGHGGHVALRVRDSEGQVLAEHPAALHWPRISLSAPVLDGGRVVGQVEVATSLWSALEHTGLMALLSSILGAIAYAALRVLPLRLLRQAIARVSYLATHDQLTGLPNRRLFHDRLAQSSAHAQRYGGGFAVLYLDLDGFKAVNDTLGHEAGDILLTKVARLLAETLRESDTLARLGGDEFAILQGQAEQPESAEALAERLVSLINQPFDIQGRQVRIGTSIGIALHGHSAPEHILQDADTALYQAKAAGRNGFCFFATEMNQAMADRRALEREIRQALDLGQFRLYFQPLVDLATEQSTGLEALLRWVHPQRGLVMPDQFIPLAEELGLLTRIGTWVMRQACAAALRWPGQRIAVNVSPNQFRSADFIGSIRAALAESGLDPRWLEIEITEAMLRADAEQAMITLRALRGLGVSIAIDDFGSSYSSLAQLQQFRFDRIKIDRSIVENLSEAPRSITMIRAVIGMAHALGLRCTAEGVETPLQAALLRAEGCDEAQGWLFGQAVTEADLHNLAAMPRASAA